MSEPVETPDEPTPDAATETPDVPEATPEETQQNTPETAPTETLGEVTPRQPVQFQSDELDQRFDQVRKAIESDDMLSESEKQMKLLELDTRREERRERKTSSARSEEDKVRDGYAARYGTTRAVVDSTWSEAVKESVRRRGAFDQGTALTILEDKLSAGKSEPTPIVKPRTVGQTHPTPRGARPAPARPEKKMTVQEMMDRAAMGDTSYLPKDVLEEARR